ncbi:hypothetical protein [Paenibacillus popilliae]|uniref:hypothetical protein n=1 Tax=Paenibacillus popilliae TaxID=78057 RepID=UPI001F2763D1|nr:hypothetical protein [Paenibacillus popilliae]
MEALRRSQVPIILAAWFEDMEVCIRMPGMLLFEKWLDNISGNDMLCVAGLSRRGADWHGYDRTGWRVSLYRT